MIGRTCPVLRILANLFFAGLLGPAGLAARDLPVADAAGLAAALQAVRPGDTVTLRDGDWKDLRLAVARGGEAGRPVVLRAETPGGVRLGGASSVELNAPHVVVEGLRFEGGAIGGGAVIQFNSHHGVVRQTAVIDYNPPAFSTAYYWVFFHGDDNLLERCYFRGKANHEPLVGNAVEGSRRNVVRGCHFRDIPLVAKANGREIIRVWGSGKTEERDDDGAYFTIEGNLFERADGEGTETISLKSNHNVVRGNTVLATRGGINIRRGNFNVVENNVVLGQGVEGAHGLRMSGRDNRVQGNYVSGCDYGIRVSCGEFIESALTPAYAPDVKPNSQRTRQVRIPTYPQVVRLTLADNVLVGNSGPDLEVGSSYRKNWPESQQVLLPEACLIRNNRLVRTQGGRPVFVTAADRSPPLDRFTFAANTYTGNVLVGGGELPPEVRAGFVVQAPAPGWSEAQELSGRALLTANDVGPAWVVARRRAGGFEPERQPPTPAPEAGAAPRKRKRDR